MVMGGFADPGNVSRVAMRQSNVGWFTHISRQHGYAGSTLRRKQHFSFSDSLLERVLELKS